ncbi:uncharacterized protein J7T54_006926 [Emericellopsis cladophorae]|uniref:Rhodopsin domain-containing protein n=1 Tax=Emericellopsis cladophorae TaxID=2686198 RepID=A0A9Q0BI82_9HYPO|nr:uncharacterized protein J7T54_006926 [Emericellopsis cladophorae]KAI6785284.1 hypothetical protein J7T54_006926 [Emericellopsis cladophorae]
MAQDGTLQGQIGAVDNLQAPLPVWNRESTIIGMTIVFTAITSTCVLLRLYARFRIMNMAGWDDYCMIFVITMGGVGTVCLCMLPGLGGIGSHLLELSDAKRQTYFKLFYVADGSFVSTVALIKLCLLLQYLRIFDRGLQRRVCLAMFILVGLWALVTSFMAWVPCFPVHAFWDWSVEDKKCYAYGSKYLSGHYATFLTHSIVNMSLDLIIFAILLPLLFRLSTQHRTKLGTNVLAALRLAETVRHKAMSYPTFDHSWYAPALCMLGMLEVNFACIGASIPVFWPVFKNRLEAIFVTREINVSVAARNSSDMQLQRLESLHSQDGSDGTKRLWREGSREVDKSHHYQDSYVIDQVDPLRARTARAVDTTVTTGGHAGEPRNDKAM